MEYNWDFLDFYDGGDNNVLRFGSYLGKKEIRVYWKWKYN